MTFFLFSNQFRALTTPINDLFPLFQPFSGVDTPINYLFLFFNLFWELIPSINDLFRQYQPGSGIDNLESTTIFPSVSGSDTLNQRLFSNQFQALTTPI
jgi:hypothetical protein